MTLDHAAAVDAIRYESSRLADLIDGGDQDAPIAACPGWAVRDVGSHLGAVQRFWTWVVGRGNSKPPDDRPAPPAPGKDLGLFVREGGEGLAGALAKAGPDAPAWAWWGEPATVGAVARHQVHEAAIHRWDVEETGGGEPEAWSAGRAVDGIDEFLFVTLSTEENPWTGPAGVLVIDPDDAEEAWTIDCVGPEPQMRRGAAGTYDLRLLGEAADLQLLLWNRPRSFRYRGEPGLLTAFLAWPEL